MKRTRISLLLSGSATIAVGIPGILAPGCDAAIRDPQAFFAEDPCNFFNCDNLFFLDSENGQQTGDLDVSGPNTDG